MSLLLNKRLLSFLKQDLVHEDILANASDVSNGPSNGPFDGPLELLVASLFAKMCDAKIITSRALGCARNAYIRNFGKDLNSSSKGPIDGIFIFSFFCDVGSNYSYLVLLLGQVITSARSSSSSSSKSLEVSLCSRWSENWLLSRLL